ncbi:MAG: OmpA family protein [Pseudomonadota bacterium]
MLTKYIDTQTSTRPPTLGCRLRQAGAGVALALLGCAMALAGPMPGATHIRNIALASYIPAGHAMAEEIESNPVDASVAAVEALLLTQDQSVSRPPNVQVALSHVLTNTGNVGSGYSFALSNSKGCAGTHTLTLSALKLVHDINNNGIADAGEAPIALGARGALTLQAGEMAVLIVQGQLPLAANGSACVALSASTDLQAQAATNHDSVAIADVAVLALTKSAHTNGLVVPGAARIDFVVAGTNIGTRDALALGRVNGIQVTVDGVPRTLLLVRDMVPAGTQYMPGTLHSAAAGALRLFRMPGEGNYVYRSDAAADHASAIEVAIGLPAGLAKNASMQMKFGVKVLAGATGAVQNAAHASFDNGRPAADSARSNTVVVALDAARIGVAKQAGVPIPNLDPVTGAPDGTADVDFSIRVKNYGSTWLYDVQLQDLAALPGMPSEGRYTILPGTLALAGGGGAIAAVDRGFDGSASLASLLEAGAVFPPDSEVTVKFKARFSINGRTEPLYSMAKALAAPAAGAGASVVDDAQNGADPDPDGDGNPNNNTAPTPVSAQLPLLAIVKSAGVPRIVAPGVYEIDYAFAVTNNGTASAPNVRVIDNLACTFGEQTAPRGAIASWQLVGGVRAANNLLVPSAGFSGRAGCDAAKAGSPDPYKFPTETALSLVDGNRSLQPGQSETLRLTVRVSQNTLAAGTRVVATNKAWAASFGQGGLTPKLLTSAAAASVQSLLVDPQGTVYDSLSRKPIAGATVTLTRQSCAAGAAGPIVQGEILGGDSGAYTYHANGSLSMATGADGAWQFYFKSPPVAGLCTYGVAVTPPAGSVYTARSERIPAAPGAYAGCGAIVPNAAPPTAADPTTHYLALVAGVNPDGSACEAVHNHIPLDLGTLTGLVLKKEGNKKQVALGEFVDYSLTVTNKTGRDIGGLGFADTLPAGFAYIGASARLDQLAADDPQGGKGPALQWSFPAYQLANGKSAVLRYRVRVGIGATVGQSAVNRATASGASSKVGSNTASHTVKIIGGVFSDEAFLFGKVYMACGGAATQDGAHEVGVPGVRLYLEDGTNVVTDGEGKWSLYGLKPVTHVVRLDQTTLPPGAHARLLDNRNAGTAFDRFADLKKGEWHKANFPLEGCADQAVLKDVEARRKAARGRPDADAEAAVRTRLDPQGLVVTGGDTRGMPAAGQVNGNGLGDLQAGAANQSSRPLIGMPGAPAGAAAANGSFINGGTGTGTLGGLQQGGSFGNQQNIPGGSLGAAGVAAGAAAGALLPPAAPGGVDLETLLPNLDAVPGFVEFKDQDTLPAQSVNVRVKGPAAAVLQLSVNGQPVDRRRVGKKATLARTGAGAWEYIGIVLKPGANTLRLDVVDDFGNVRGKAVEISVVAPDKLGIVHFEAPSGARADGRTPVPVTVRLTDAAGVPVSARTQVTLETEAGRWVEADLNPAEAGLQAFIEKGKAVFHLVPPAQAGDVRLRLSASGFQKEAVVTLLPDLRPMLAVGIIEGAIDLSKRGRLDVGQIPAAAAFEQELRAVSGSDGDTRGAARAAFFLKGAVRGEYLLTAAVDTDKGRKDRLFRDIRPDEFYPIYGDASSRGYDAQSAQRLYVRIDKDRSYLLYGDFSTAGSAEVRKLSQTNRILTGVRSVLQDDARRITSYGARVSHTRQVEEFQAKGISGPYYLAGAQGEFLENSEQIELLVRDRTQPDLVVHSTPLARFVDYTIEPLSRRILFTRPLASMDAKLNPQSVRVTYEVDNGGPKYTVAGSDAQFKVGERLQLGLVANTDQDPQNRRDLAAVTALARLGAHTTAAAEVVATRSDAEGSGNAARIELRHQDDKLAAAAQATHTSDGFDNPGAGVAGGRTEATVRAELRIDPLTQVRAEGFYSKDGQAGAEAVRGTGLSVQRKLNEVFTGELGLRYGSSSSNTASLFDYNGQSSYSSAAGGNQSGASIGNLGSAANGAGAADANALVTVRGRLTVSVPGSPQAQLFVEGEQNLQDAGRHLLAVGGSYALTDKTRLYGRYEAASSLYNFSGTQSRNIGMLGIESNYMEGGRIYNEYRLADAIDGRSAAAALGIRNSFKLGANWRATAGIERTEGVDGAAGGGSTTGQESTAVVGGLEYSAERVRASGIFETRRGDDSDTMLSSLSLAYKIDDDWSLLTRAVLSASKGRGVNEGSERKLSRSQLGLAYRPVAQDVWNALARYEYKTEGFRGGGAASGVISGNAFGADAGLPGDSAVHIASVHLNYNPGPADHVTARIAAKRASYDELLGGKGHYAAQLLQGRWTHDLGRDWDIGFQAGISRGSGGARQTTAGVELGYQLSKDLWLSAGYNVSGLRERDLAAGEYTNKGAYIRLRYKFGEGALGFKPAPAAAQSAPPPAPAPAPQAPPAPAPAPTREPVKAMLSAEVLFDTATALLKPSGHAVLDKLVAELKAAGTYNIVLVTGHTDSVGTDGANQKLSEARAVAVRDYLVANGLDGSKLSTSGKGEAAPVAPNDTPEGRAKNRRVEIEESGA